MARVGNLQIRSAARISAVPGHIAFRRVAWEMFKALKEIVPNLASGIESCATDPDTPIDTYDR